jgi:hypothetical protein
MFVIIGNCSSRLKRPMLDKEGRDDHKDTLPIIYNY